MREHARRRLRERLAASDDLAVRRVIASDAYTAAAKDVAREVLVSRRARGYRELPEGAPSSSRAGVVDGHSLSVVAAGRTRGVLALLCVTVLLVLLPTFGRRIVGAASGEWYEVMWVIGIAAVLAGPLLWLLTRATVLFVVSLLGFGLALGGFFAELGARSTPHLLWPTIGSTLLVATLPWALSVWRRDGLALRGQTPRD